MAQEELGLDAAAPQAGHVPCSPRRGWGWCPLTCSSKLLLLRNISVNVVANWLMARRNSLQEHPQHGR